MKRTYFSLFACCLFFGCSDPAPEPQTNTDSIAVQDNPDHAGKDVFLMYCAQCHGETGDGTASIELDRPARSFLDGGFSFGNTVHAISKTTASGIPGTPMPPFVDILTPEQINAVASYVRTLAPTVEEASGDDIEMIVTNRPMVIRGMLPPLSDSLQLHPRGVVIGNPDRFSYEYDADHVRLLAIRQGKFVNRADWGERGGAPLELLGNIVTLVEQGNPAPLFNLPDGTPLRAQLTSTSIYGSRGTVSYALIDAAGVTVASVTEQCNPTTGVRTLIEQHFDINTTIPLLISPPSTAILVRPKELPAGTHDFKLVHASVGSDS